VLGQFKYGVKNTIKNKIYTFDLVYIKNGCQQKRKKYKKLLETWGYKNEFPLI
jgi:hypothetical protein